LRIALDKAFIDKMIVSALKSSDGLADISSQMWFQSLSSVHGQSLRVFCFPYAGGNTSGFRSWQRNFPPEIDLCLVHLPGRGKRIGEPMFTRLNLLVQTVADLIMREPQPPYVLFGHSMGALISFELARELRRRRFAAPRRLFLSGRSAPNVANRAAPIFNLPEKAFIAEVKKFNGTPTELLENPEAMKLFLPALRADLEMLDTYEYYPEESLSCPITVYGGLQDTGAPEESLRAWKEHTSASCNLRLLPGDHFFIHSPGIGFGDFFWRDVMSTLHHPEPAG
jgi:medium-chain acyl-[acyl-carrier-protein] hydrolase